MLETLINSVSEECKDSVLVSLRSREKAIASACSFLQSQDDLQFWSITITPEYGIKSRGKTKMFKDCRVAEQYHYFNHRIMKYTEYSDFLYDSIIVIEHSKSGNIHFHLITPKTQHIQNVKSDIIRLFDLNTRRMEHLNINVKPVDDLFKSIAYIFKSPIDWVANKDCPTIDLLMKVLLLSSMKYQTIMYIF